MSSVEHDIEIRSVPAALRVDALWQLFAWESEVQRRERLATVVELSRADPAAFQFLFEAIRDGHRLGCAWGHVAPGRIANVWPPNCREDCGPILCDRLQSTLDRELAAAGIDCGQSLLPRQAEYLAKTLLRNGYRQAAQLLFLACDRAQFPSACPSADLLFETYREDQFHRLATLIDDTYVGSLDAPLLNGLRSTHDVINGYRLTGNHAPDRWYFVRHRDRDVGCLLLTAHQPGRQWELIYMGIVPSARGRGWGESITRHAQWLAGEADCRTLLLGVDADNQPAIATYARCGFRELDRRLALIKKFETAAE